MKRIYIFALFILFLAYNSYAQQWDKDSPAGSINPSDIDYYVENNNVALDRLLADHNTIGLFYKSASDITASLGTVTVSNSDGSVRLFLGNTSNTTITWADIDTGAEGNATYYVYAVAALVTSETATFKISLDSTAPDSALYYKKIGSFYNNSSSNIDRQKIYNEPYGLVKSESSGIPPITAIFDYASSTSSFTARSGGLKVAYGVASVGSSSSATITNLPFSSSSTYRVVVCYASSTAVLEAATATNSSGSSFVINNGQASSRTINWIAVGY